MTEEELKTCIFRLLKSVASNTESETLKPDDHIRTTLEINSCDYLQFIVAIDEQFGIDTPEVDYGKIQTLRTLITYLLQKEKKMV